MRRTRIAWGWRLLWSALAAAMMTGSAVAENISPAEPKETMQNGPQLQHVEVNVDATRVLEPFNRNLFSIAGFAQLFQFGSELAKKRRSSFNWKERKQGLKR